MKKIFGYGKHFLKAKGRHGTHSPFVYAFVEQVLRNKGRIKLNGAFAQSGLSRKELNLLGRTIAFLKPSIILADEPLTDHVQQMIPDLKRNDIPVVSLNEDHIKQGSAGKMLVVSLCNSIESADLIRLSLTQPHIYVLLLKPHDHLAAEENWYALSALPQIKMRLDLWYIGLLINDPAFKASQYFRLR